MALAVRPPVAPMLGRVARALPPGGNVVYEPKWDGFRCLAFRDGDAVDLRSRHDRPLARYFPEVVAGLRAVPAESFAVDGELVVVGPGGFDFSARLARLHPATSRVDRLGRETPAAFVAFDVLGEGDEDARGRPFAERRARLERLLADVPPPVHLTPATDDVRLAQAWLDRFQGAGIDGVMVKERSSLYLPGARAMLKVKPDRTADCVVAGARVAGDPPAVHSLLLGLHDEQDVLRHVGVVTAFRAERRRELAREIAPHVVDLAGHPWEHGYLLEGGATGRFRGAAGRWDPAEMELDWVPLPAAGGRGRLRPGGRAPPPAPRPVPPLAARPRAPVVPDRAARPAARGRGDARDRTGAVRSRWRGGACA